ncbi:BTAD domain-containing putative transcriptional regulator [Streptomyces sp. NPDC048305]|uniref:AfsR/SARP family transcriptional regulator n=1 Tax=Streptomyces sp. NPDC048305 TaxID=3365532 RepID=UPI0037210A7A
MGEPAFGVLGPLRVKADGVTVRIGGAKPRAVLATLLLQPNGFVSVDLLTEVLWPGGAPRSAVANVRTHVRTLRQLLPPAAVAALRTEPGGYALDVAPGELDALLFERRLAQARAARDRGEDAGALRGYEAALGLWRGGVLQDVRSSVVWDPAVARIEELRSLAADECLEVRLRLGDYAHLVSGLRSRLTESPLREDLWRMLVHALRDAGRVAEARSAYAEAERVIAAELGVEPSAPLRAIGAEVNGYAGHRRSATPAPVCQLPMDIPDFMGRAAEVADLEALLSTAGRHPVVAAVSGPPGAGKSTLAVHVAHRVRTAFPDGQLFADLAGTSECPREPAEVLAGLLRGLGVIDSAIPGELGERAAMFRSRLAQRRCLIVLDDAVDAAQVSPLLPGTGGSAVLVTSRRRMPGLPAHACPLGLMRYDDARALFGAIVGTERLLREGADADRVLAECGSLPLAVRIAAARLVNRPGWSVSTLADSLRDERGRLGAVRSGELEVRAGAELSYRHLPEPAALAFRTFGDLPDDAVPGWLVAVATGEGGEAGGAAGGAAGGLETLLDEHLVEVVGRDELGLNRYRMHDLLRSYARELALTDHQETRMRRRLAVIDALTALARTANAAMPTRFLGVLGGDRAGHGDAGGGPPGAVAALVRERPVDWFESEHRNLVSAVDAAVRLGRTDRAAALAIELAGFFDMRGYYGDWLRTHRLVLDAMPSHDGAGGAALLRNLGQLHLYQDRYEDALTSFDRSRALFAELGHRTGEAVAAVGAGSVHRVVGELDSALRMFTVALRHFAATGDPHGEAVARNAIASVWLERQDPEAAAGWLRGALELSLVVGDRHREAQVRRRVAVLHELRGEPQAARRELEHALGIFDELADLHCAAYVQQSIAELCLRQGESGEASALLVGALAVQQQLGDRRAEARVAGLLGELHDATGRTQTARHYFHRSLATWRRLDVPDEAGLMDARLRALR